MANEKDNKKETEKEAATKTPVTKEEADAIQNEVLKSVVGGVGDGSADWEERGGSVGGYWRFSSC